MDEELAADPLTYLAIRHGTDKWGQHFYTPHYHAWFASLRDRPVRLLEIGVGGYDLPDVGGNSLAMWADYFPQGRIVAIDIAPKRLTLDPRITILQGSQDDAGFLAQVSREHGPFDIIIDDGSHMPKHVVASFNALFPLMPDGGIYVIEDVQTTFWPRFGGSLLDGGGTMKLAHTLLSHINHAEIRAEQPSLRYADWVAKVRAFHAVHNLFMIEKGDNSEPSNFGYDLRNPHAGRAIAMIERQMRSEPTPDGIAGLINLCAIAGDFDRAQEFSTMAASQWPQHAGLRAAIAHLDGARSRRDRKSVV